jgi:hypothetical protein
LLKFPSLYHPTTSPTKPNPRMYLARVSGTQACCDRPVRSEPGRPTTFGRVTCCTKCFFPALPL